MTVENTDIQAVTLSDEILKNEGNLSGFAQSALDFLSKNKDYELKLLGHSLILTIPIKDTRLPERIRELHEIAGFETNGVKILDMNSILEEIACVIPEQKYLLILNQGQSIKGNAAQIAFEFCMKKRIRLYIQDKKLFAQLESDSKPEFITTFRTLDNDTESAYVLFFYEYLMKQDYIIQELQ